MTAPGAGIHSRIMREGIVCLSSIDWDFIWQQNQEIMSRFAKAGTPVLFIENTGIRAPGLRDMPRIWARFRNWWRSAEGFREIAPNLIVLSPLLLPFPYSRLARWVNSRLIARSITAWMRATRRNAPVLWTFLPTPLVHDIIADLEPALVVYYYTANFAASSAGARGVAESEDKLLRRADIVFVTSKALRARALEFREQAHFVPMGVDFETFEVQRQNSGKEPDDLAAIPHPRFIYVGGLHHWVDFEMLAGIAAARPGWHLVLIGPKQTELTAVESLHNVHVLGPRPFGELPRYLVAADVGLIPYRQAKYTESVYPTKLNEYLAAGIPVVSTALPEVLAYAKEYPGSVHLAETTEDFEEVMQEALADAAAGRERRIAAARRNGWVERVAEMAERMSAALDENSDALPTGQGHLRRLVGRHPLRAAGVLFLAAHLMLFWSPLLWWLAEPLRPYEAPRKADAIVVLGGGAGEAGVLGRHEERIARAVELYKAGYAPRILLCSGERTLFRELDAMRGLALAHGVRPSDLMLEEGGGGTANMVKDAVRHAHESGWGAVLLVSSSYHMRRAVGTWRRAGADVAVIPTPVMNPRFYRPRAAAWGRTGPSLEQMRGLAQEAFALMWYRYRGWI